MNVKPNNTDETVYVIMDHRIPDVHIYLAYYEVLDKDVVRRVWTRSGHYAVQYQSEHIARECITTAMLDKSRVVVALGVLCRDTGSFLIKELL
jgi:hypothetical protein